MTVLDKKDLIRLKVMVKDIIYYVLHDPAKRKSLIFHDEQCLYRAGLYHWQEREIVQTIEKNVNEELYLV